MMHLLTFLAVMTDPRNSERWDKPIETLSHTAQKRYDAHKSYIGTGKDAGDDIDRHSMSINVRHFLPTQEDPNPDEEVIINLYPNQLINAQKSYPALPPERLRCIIFGGIVPGIKQAFEGEYYNQIMEMLATKVPEDFLKEFPNFRQRVYDGVFMNPIIRSIHCDIWDTPKDGIGLAINLDYEIPASVYSTNLGGTISISQTVLYGRRVRKKSDLICTSPIMTDEAAPQYYCGIHEHSRMYLNGIFYTEAVMSTGEFTKEPEVKRSE